MIRCIERSLDVRGVHGGGYSVLYHATDDCEALKCDRCGIVYASKVLSRYGIEHYWPTYESMVHMKDEKLSRQRKAMYQIEYDFIKRYMAPQSAVLDVGCSNGDFLDYFKKDGHICEGVEFGKDAFEQAAKRYRVYYGELSKADIKNQYDLIVLRGVVQYLLHPKDDLKKAISLLKQGGLLYISSSPNADSVCHRIFGNKARLTVDPTNYYMFTEKILSDFLSFHGMRLFADKDFYLNTPYEDIENDICSVAKAFKLRKQDKEITWTAPAFFDSMLSLVYKKI